MTILWAASGAVAGLPAGTSLRGQVYRLSVRSGEPDQMCCRECAAPLPRGPALRCAHCWNWLGAPLAVELAAAAIIALIAARFGGQPSLAAFTYLGILGLALAQVDTAVQRLPDQLTWPAYPALIVLLVLAAAAGKDGTALLRALLAGLALVGGYLVLALIGRGQLGGGDVKLAGLIGLALGWAGWGTVIDGASLGFILAALASLVLLASRRISRRTMISFGPYMLAGALLALVAAG